MFKIPKRNIKTSIVITYQDTALEGYVDQDYLGMSSISTFSILSLMSDFMGYHEFGGIWIWSKNGKLSKTMEEFEL